MRGRPSLWASAFHLFVGNLIIGCVEAAILIRWFRAAKPRAYRLMIVANYVSMIAGVAATSWGKGRLSDASVLSIVNLRAVLIGLGLGAYLLSVCLELPFVAFAVAREHRSFARCLCGSLLANAASYAGLVILYWQISGTSLITSAHIEAPSHFCASPTAEIYYIGINDGAIYRVKASGGIPEKFLELGAKDRSARLFAKQADDEGMLDLWIAGFPKRESTTVAQRAFARIREVAVRDAQNAAGEERDGWMDFGWARTFDPASSWKIWTGFWPLEGLRASDEITGQRYGLALETPQLAWPSRSATLLPEAQVIYQLGQQIVLLDLPTKRMGLIALGRGPLIVRRQKPGK